jgi:hypothetical protein
MANICDAYGKVVDRISYKSAKKLFESPTACPLFAFFLLFPAKVYQQKPNYTMHIAFQ